ncbi:MAG: hypothetical protein IJC71_06585 [Clostridia bacterium]|nr:hypothetical protein [Clostridia bacterium]
MTKKKTIIGYLISGLIVILLTGAMVFGTNAAMEAFMDYDVKLVQAAAFRSEQMKKAAEEGQSAALQLQAEIMKHEQMELFYQQNKNRTYYHYYGQYYELFNNVYNADTLFIGTSHASHGVNPLYIEENFPNRSFFNFALNGSVPSYYLNWYNILKREANYPIPRTVIYCVDWFMFDTGWLWRRISYDEPADMPLGMMRAIKKKEEASQNTGTDQTGDASGEDTAVTEQKELTILEKIKAANPKKIDDVMTVVLQYFPVFSSRDRLPEMFRWMLGEKQPIPAPLTEAELEEIAQSYEGDAQIPVYEHNYLKDSAQNLTHLYYKGYIPWDVRYGGGTGGMSCNYAESEWTAFTALMEKFKEDGVEVIFVEIPEYNAKNAGSRKKYNEKIAAYAEENGIPFLNYNMELKSEINDDHTNYSDWGHMNLAGSTKFSEILGEDLKEVLED